MLNACTIIACNYLPYARVLAESFFQHHPDGGFAILLIDDEAGALACDDHRIRWLRLSDIGFDQAEVYRLAGIYDVTELATAVKPVLLTHLLDAGHDAVVYLDPDIRIFAPLDPVAALAQRHGIVLTPHTMHAYPKDDRRVDGFFVLAAGVYNLGFLAVGPSARPFLEWWWESTRREALIDVTRMMFTDQRWVDFVPSLFDHHILKDPGYNVAYWNLHGRELELGPDGYLVNGVPLRFFHFSGFDVRTPWLLSKHQGAAPRVLLSERPTVARLCGEYRTALADAGGSADDVQPYGWGKLPGGLPITTRMRRLYWSSVVAAEQGKIVEPPNPFAEPDAFIAWLNEPAEGGPRRVSKFLYSIYLDRLDLQVHFPDIFGADAHRFAEWIWTDGATQAKVPLELLPPRVETGDATDAGRVGPALRDGVTIAGYFRAELGIGEAARLLASAVEAAGIPHATTTYDATLSRQSHPFDDRKAAGAAYDINVICVNADGTPRFARDIGAGFFAGRYNVGYWFWEVEEFPAAMHAAFDVVDEVWTATDFIAQSIGRAGVRPVHTVPLPVPVPQFDPALGKTHFGLPDRFTFLLLFDFLSVVERKNPRGLIKAFTDAFAPGEGPTLVLKSINGHLRLSALEELRAAAAGRTDIRIVDGYLSGREKSALLAASDCYVSLHRSEGLGLTMAEAMALGKPVIATAYSGNLHFMTPENSYLVDYQRIAVPRGSEPYPQSTMWADPDLARASAQLREVYERPDLARVRGERGRRDILEQHNLAVSGAAIARRVAAIRKQRRSRVADPPPQNVMPDPASRAPEDRSSVDRLAALIPHLQTLSTLRLSAEGRSLSQVRLFGQRALFRVLRPLWFQQHQFYEQLLTALRLIGAALRDEHRQRDNVEIRLRELTRRLLSTRREQTKRLLSTERELTRLADRLNHEQRDARFDALDARLGTLEAQPPPRDPTAFQTNAAAHLEALTTAVQQTESDIAKLQQRLFAVPYMSEPAALLERDPDGRERLGYRAAEPVGSKGTYLGFEDVFRGPESLIRERQRVYLPLLAGRRRVMDLGCGRGEMLDVLKEAAVAADGVDLDPEVVRYARSKGHDVRQDDVVAALEAEPAGSVPAMFSAQVIEHLPYPMLQRFLRAARTALEPGGVLVVETVNPHALEAFKTFHTDLTHQHPIFPEVALVLCRLAGFESAYVMFPNGSGELSPDRQTQGEYAVVATAARVPPSRTARRYHGP